MTYEEAMENIIPTVSERNTVITRDHLIDDYVLGRNIAKYGLKFTTVRKIHQELGLGESGYLWHQYTLPPEQKIIEMKKVLKGWALI
jgi:hypothetical protein